VTASHDDLVDWLLEGDPSIRWKVQRDLLDAPPGVVERERSRVATEGWGARLLALQDPDGRWAGGCYSPKWTSTTYTLLHLHWLGLPPGNPRALAGCERLWVWRETWRKPETCIMGMLVLLSSTHGYDDGRLDETVGWLLDQQLDDGGWNCATLTDKTKHSSFHTSITALDGLLLYQAAGGDVPVQSAMERGREFFLRHRLYHSHRTGEVAIRGSTRFPQLPQWHFDVLRGLEHFVGAGATQDPRLSDAVDVVRRARRRDGRWPTYSGYPGRSWFRMEEPGASRWNTLRALRVLRWWGGEPPSWASGVSGGRGHGLGWGEGVQLNVPSARRDGEN